MTATENGNRIAVLDKPDNALANLTDGARFEQLQRVATMMGSAAFTPQHLRGKTPAETTANCFRVVNQAMRWGFDPFAVGDETYVVHGRLGYQGKLVAAVINARAGLDGRLKADFSGSGEGRTVTIIGKFIGEDKPRTVELTISQAKTTNEMWKKDPDQKLWYSGVVKWSRRHCPELILGVMTDDDLERIAANEVTKRETVAASIDAEILASPTVEAETVADQAETPSEPVEQPKAPEAEIDPESVKQSLLERIKAAKSTVELDKLRGEWMKSRVTLGEPATSEVKADWDAAYKSLKAAK